MKDRARSARNPLRSPRLRAFVVYDVPAEDETFYDIELTFAKSARKAVALALPHARDVVIVPHRDAINEYGESIVSDRRVVVERAPQADCYVDRERVANRRRDTMAQRAAGFMWEDGSSSCEDCDLHPIEDRTPDARRSSLCRSCERCGFCGHATDCPGEEPEGVWEP